MKARVTINRGALNAELANVTGRSARNAAFKIRNRARANVRASGRVDTGEMLNGIQAVRTAVGPRSTYTVTATAPHSGFHERGIGPVVPRRAKVLRFTPKGSSVAIFRPRTRGFAGIHFMERAIRGIGPKDFVP